MNQVRLKMQTAVDADLSKRDPGGQVGTRDKSAWLFIGYRLFALMVIEQRYYGPNTAVLPLIDDASALQLIDEIERGIWKGPIPELALIDTPSNIPAEKIGKRIRESRQLGRIAIILVSSRPLNSQQEARLKLRTCADAVMYQPLPTPMDFRQMVAQILLDKP